MAGDQFFAVTDTFASFTGSILVYDFDRETGKADEKPRIAISLPEKNRITSACWGLMDKTIITADDSGAVAVWDISTQKKFESFVHSSTINRISMDYEKSMVITASKDGTSKLLDAKTLDVLKVYETGRPVNCAVISPLKPHILLGGGEASETVTTTKADTRQFSTRFFHKVYSHEIGSYMGHFGTMNCIAISPDGKIFATGAEDAYIRLHHMDQEYLELPDL